MRHRDLITRAALGGGMLAAITLPAVAATPAALPLAGGGFLSPSSTDTWVLAAFLIFIGVLYWTGAFGFIGRALDARALGIRNQLDEARKLREEAQGKLAEFQRMQADVQKQAAEIVEKAKADAEAARVDALKSIEASVAQRMKSAEEQIAMAEAEAVRAVRNGAVDAAVAATQATLKKAIGSAEAGSLMDKAIAEVTTRVN